MSLPAVFVPPQPGDSSKPTHSPGLSLNANPTHCFCGRGYPRGDVLNERSMFRAPTARVPRADARLAPTRIDRSRLDLHRHRGARTVPCRRRRANRMPASRTPGRESSTRAAASSRVSATDRGLDRSTASLSRLRPSAAKRGGRGR
jgi:hypothetical protein